MKIPVSSRISGAVHGMKTLTPKCPCETVGVRALSCNVEMGRVVIRFPC